MQARLLLLLALLLVYPVQSTRFPHLSPLLLVPLALLGPLRTAFQVLLRAPLLRPPVLPDSSNKILVLLLLAWNVLLASFPRRPMLCLVLLVSQANSLLRCSPTSVMLVQ